MSFYPTPDIKARLLPLTFRKDDRSLEPFNDRFTVLPRDPADSTSLSRLFQYPMLNEFFFRFQSKFIWEA
jgi:hypothetical protein